MNKIQKPFKIIAAMCEDRGIGRSGTIPWNYPEDLAYFMRTTKSARGGFISSVIMGRKTWESLPDGGLKGRLNIVLTSQHRKLHPVADEVYLGSLMEAYVYLQGRPDVDPDAMWIVGGAELYSEALLCNWSNELHLTDIPGKYTCDTYFPLLPRYWFVNGACHKAGSLNVHVYRNRYAAHYEKQYLDQMNHLRRIPPIVGRNGPVHTDFQWSFSMDLADGLPLFSTRRGFWRGICEELLFFIHGDTNSGHLSDKGIRIWEGNTTREFLDSRGLTEYAVGDMGPMYGWVWRNYGARYHGMDHDYTDEGYDQLRHVIDKLLTAPNDRRILMTAYDPSKVKDSVLAPCHSIVTHFFVREEEGRRFLDMYTYQRSADMFLGVYFNIPSDATLQMIIAQATGLIPGKMHVQFGNNHVYHEHLEALQEQLARTPSETLPTLRIAGNPGDDGVEHALSWIEGLTYKDFQLDEYQPQGHIKADMVA